MALISQRVEMARIGDAVLQATGALRMNYEILGNSEPELHCHLFPRYAAEPEKQRKMPAWFYDWKTAPPMPKKSTVSCAAKLPNGCPPRN